MIANPTRYKLTCRTRVSCSYTQSAFARRVPSPLTKALHVHNAILPSLKPIFGLWHGLTNPKLALSTHVVRARGKSVGASEDEAKSILLVAPDPRLRNLLQLRYEVLGYLVTAVPDGAMAAQLLQNLQLPDLVVIDSNMPTMDGYSVFLSLRQLAADVTYMLLLSSEEMLTVQLELGAAQYVVKPFTPQELEIRTEKALLFATQSQPMSQATNRFLGKAQAGRSVPAMDPVSAIVFGRVVINVKLGQVYKDGAKVNLTKMEYTILEYLALHTDEEPVSTKFLKEYVNRQGMRSDGFEEEEDGEPEAALAGDTRTISVHVFNLRKKLEDNLRFPTLILTKYDKETKTYGYTLTTSKISCLTRMYQ